MMDNHDQTTNNERPPNEEGKEILSMIRVTEEDTYPISDSDSTSLIETNLIQVELSDSMSRDSLVDDEPEEYQAIPSSIINTQMNHKPPRSNHLDEHIKLVQQKKEEAELLRLQKVQEQLRKKDQKWQQQQLERVKKWLQLRNRDTDHRSQVEERRRKRDEEAKAKFDEILRREKEREQRNNSQISTNLRGNASHKSGSLMSASTDILSTRRAISAPRIRSNYRNMTNRRGSNDSPVTIASQETADDAATASSSHQRNPIDGHRYHRSLRSHDATMTNDESSLSGTPRASVHSRSRPVPTSYSFWLNTGDNNNHLNANFMRSTYATSCRSRLTRSVERCPRACRVHDEVANNTTTAATTTTNGEPAQRRIQSINRQHLNETIRRLSKPKSIPMSQSTHLNVTPSSSTNGMSLSQSSHQLRVTTPPIPTNNYSSTTPISSHTRRHLHSRSATASSYNVSSNNDSRTSPSDELTSERPSTPSSIRSSSQRTTTTHSKPPSQSSSKPPVSSSFSRPKPPVPRSIMSTSLSSSALSSTTPTNKQNIRRIGGTPPSKQKAKAEPAPAVETPAETEVTTKDNDEENRSVNEDTQETEPSVTEVQPSISSSVEPINIDTVTEIINPTEIAPVISKREQQISEEQEYQLKLNQKIREAQQRLEVERQREEERQRQLELEEYEREQEQIRLVEEQRQAEQERLQRAIDERERENELKRQEEQRLQQQREELEKKQAEETERLNRERQERAKKEEEERNERKKRLDLIMRRTRQVSPTPKPEMNDNKSNMEETNDHDQEQSSVPHSISDNPFPTSASTDNFLNTNHDLTSATETPKFKSPLIQSLLNKARNTRSTDNLIQSSMTASQIIAESETDATTTARTASSDDEDQQDSGINNTTNGHNDSPLSSSTTLNSSHDHPVEASTTFQSA